MTLPLDGIRVLDVSVALAAPVTATILGDFGAEVVKVEQPTVGDFTRGRAERPGGRSLQWVQEGRNKKSITLNLREPEAQDMLHGLVPQFDVMVTNYRLPTLQKWRMEPETLHAIHPSGILAYITGYGLSGPLKHRGAFDRVASAFSGLTYVSGYPEHPPVRGGYAVIDYMAAYLASSSIMMALYHRDCHGGGGQVIDFALYEAGFRAAEDALVDYSYSGTIRERDGNRNPYIVPANDFRTRDGRHIAIHAGTQPLFKRLVAVMEMPSLDDDARFSSNEARIANQDELYRAIASWTATCDATDLIESLSAHDIPASLVMSIADIADSPHYRERGTIQEVNDEEYGELLLPSPIPKFSETPGRIRSLGPALGHHNSEIYGNLLGLSEEELDSLKHRGIV